MERIDALELVNHGDRQCTPYHRDFRSLTNQWFTFHVCSNERGVSSFQIN